MEEAISLPTVGAEFAAKRSGRRDLIEIVIGYILILIVIWTPRPWQQYFWMIAVAGIGVIIAASFDHSRSVGLGGRNFFRSLWIVGVALLASAVTVAIAARLHTLRDLGPMELIGSFWSYAVFAGVQQFLLQCFFLTRLVRLLPKPRYAAVVAASLFGLAHLPNPVLLVLTIVWGTMACLIFLRYRNVYPLAIAHAILGITIALSVPGPVHHNMRVGLGYLHYRKDWTRPPIQRSHRDQIASTEAWVTAEAPTRRSVRHARP
jgi:Type II CAAX prenyl endopeptidase Rce1-like